MTAPVRLTLFLFVVGAGVWVCHGPKANAEEAASYPWGAELRTLAQDVESPAYRDIVKAMTFQDLKEEWKRVATPDNYLLFRDRHGGLAQVLADPEKKAAYEQREHIATAFLALMRDAYSANGKAFDIAPEDIEQLLLRATTRSGVSGDTEEMAITSVMPAPGADTQWPCFRGPTGQGVSPEADFPLTWSATENILWKAELSGRGNSSPVAWADRVFITTASKDGTQRELLCYNRHSGDLLWTKAAPRPATIEQIQSKNSYASSTPVTDGDRVIAFFGNSGFVCFGMNGDLLWTKTLGAFTLTHGPGTNPVMYRDKIIFIQDQNTGDSVFVALNKYTGDILWQQKRDKVLGWATPVIVHVGGHDELIYNGSHHVVGYDPDSGEQLWTLAGPTKEAVPMIVSGGGLIYSASGRNGTVLAFRPAGKGDITQTHLCWSNERGGPHVPSPVYHQNRLYLVNDTGIMTCLDAQTGKTVWLERLKGCYTASPVLVGDKLILTNEKGLTTILETGDRFKVLAQNDLAEETLASPAVLGGRLYLRTASHLFCIGKQQ